MNDVAAHSINSWSPSATRIFRLFLLARIIANTNPFRYLVCQSCLTNYNSVCLIIRFSCHIENDSSNIIHGNPTSIINYLLERPKKKKWVKHLNRRWEKHEQSEQSRFKEFGIFPHPSHAQQPRCNDIINPICCWSRTIFQSHSAAFFFPPR